MSEGPETPATVGDYMTPSPHCIGVDQPLERAREWMREMGVRHLPVRDGGQLVGVLSERDVALVGLLAPSQLGTTAVEEAMTPIPYCVTAETPLAEVTKHMAARKLGSAVVMDGNEVVGVFTTSDALEALSRALGDHGGDDARSRVKSISVPPPS